MSIETGGVDLTTLRKAPDYQPGRGAEKIVTPMTDGRRIIAAKIYREIND